MASTRVQADARVVTWPGGGQRVTGGCDVGCAPWRTRHCGGVADERQDGHARCMQASSGAGDSSFGIPYDMRERLEPRSKLWRGDASLRFDPDPAGLEMREEAQNLAASQHFANDNGALGVNSVNLKNARGQVQANYGNLHNGWLPLLVVALTATTLWRFDAVSGSHLPHLLLAGSV